MISQALKIDELGKSLTMTIWINIDKATIIMISQVLNRNNDINDNAIKFWQYHKIVW